MKSRYWAWVFCLALVSVCSTNSASAEKRWFQVQTAHFSIVTDAGEKRGIEVARRCEGLRVAFATLMDKAHAQSPAPLLILALNGENEVDALTQVGGRRSRHAGMFLPGTRQSFIVFDVSGNSWHTLFHEYAHELLYANTPADVQTWFDEGFAEYFSTLELRDNRVELGRVPVAELQFLRQNGRLMRLADLFRVNQDSDIYNHNGPSQAIFYGQSWLLVHYLFDHQMIARAAPFFSMMSSGVAADEAVQKSFGSTPAKLEQELLLYAKGEQFRYFSLPQASVADSVEESARELSPITASALMAEVRWQCSKIHSPAEAKNQSAEYKSLLVREPKNATVLRELGLTLLDSSQYAASWEYIGQALQIEPNDPLNHHAAALWLNSVEAAHSAALPPGFSSQAEAAVCIRLDPNFADCFRLRAAALARQGEFDTAAATLRDAIALSPRVESYQLELAGINLEKHEYGAAVALLRELKNSHNPEIARQAEYTLASQSDHER